MGCIKSRPMKARITPPSSPYYIPFHRIDGQLKDYERELAIYQMEIEDEILIGSQSLSPRNLQVREWIVDSHPDDIEKRLQWLTLLRSLIADFAYLTVRIRQMRGKMSTQRRHHSSLPNLHLIDNCDCDDDEE